MDVMDYSGSSLDILSQNPSARIAVKSLFFAPAGSQLKFWIETTEVPNHPRIFRRLKANSACVVHDPREADFIIVNASSVSGRKLLRDWGHDPSKVLLDFSWVQRSLDNGRPLLEDDQYGHCRLFDDGRSISDDDDDYTHVPQLLNLPPLMAQLPTPRPTPTTSISTASVSAAHSPPSGMSQLPPPTTSLPVNNNQLIAPIQSQLMPPQFWPQMTTSTTQFLPSSGMVVPYGQQFPPSNGQMMPFADPNYMALFELFCRQHAQQQQYQGQQQNLLQQQPYLLQPPPSQPLSQQLQSSLPTRQLSLEANANMVGTPFAMPQPSQHQLQGPSNIQHPLPGTTLVNHLIQSRSTTVTPAAPPTREDSPTIVEPGSEGWSKRPMADPLQTRTEPAMFEEEVGVPLKFLVQIQIKNRSQITKSIKRHGGKIISTVSDAHFAVLNSRGGDYDSLKRQADYHSVPVLNPSFVTECEARGTFLNTVDYQIPVESSENIRGKKQQSARTSSTKKSTKSNPYTPEEREYFQSCVARALRKAPNASNSVLATFLHKKMPTHTVGSWTWFCRQNSDEIERIRTEIDATPQSRVKLEPSQIGAGSGDEASKESVDSLQRKPDTLPSIPSCGQMPKSEPSDGRLPDEEATTQAKQGDFDFVRRFFASGAGDDGTEDEVWEMMGKLRSCGTAQSWKEFCTENCAQIAKEQEDLALQPVAVTNS